MNNAMRVRRCPCLRWHVWPLRRARFFAMRVGDSCGLTRLEYMPGENPTIRCRRLDVLRALRRSFTGFAVMFAGALAAELAAPNRPLTNHDSTE